MKTYFEDLKSKIFNSLNSNEALFLNWIGDDTQFIRFNAAKVRQSGVVENNFLEFTLVLGEKENALRRVTGQITLSGSLTRDLEVFKNYLNSAREELKGMPFDPLAELPKNLASSQVNSTQGRLLDRGQVASSLLQPLKGEDVAGIYAAGKVSRGMANSAGLFHWFETETFNWDYSLYTPDQKAVKCSYAGTNWNIDDYAREATASREMLKKLEIPAKKVPRGNYRVYLAPAALSEIIQMLCSVGLSEFAIQKSQSPLRLIRNGEKKLSTHLNLSEDFSTGSVPRFNDQGEVSAERMDLIQSGLLKETLVSSRSAKEFNLNQNGASQSEALRAPSVAAGSLKEEEILSSLGTGLYLSNLHYLNWSDQVNGRITGMTRYACFWVENGKIVSPIENLRFDETLFDLLGHSLEALTARTATQSEIHTYLYRHIGGVKVPGALLSEMKFTL